MVNKLTLPAKANDVQSKVNELVDDKQDTLVSGTNIKTINNTSILGSGNIAISTGETYTAGDGIDITSGVISVDNTVALKTDLPTVNNATLTIQKNGTDVQTFTANASSNVTANITVPTNTNELTNGAGFITGITSSDVTTALGYTPYNSTNPSGYQANVIETVKVNGTALTPSSKAVDITVPTSASDVGAVASNTAITGATKCKITYDSKGLVTAGADLQASDIPDISATYQTKITSSNKVSASNVSGLATVATSGSYSDLTGTPTIPTVNNATLTIQKNGTTVNTFTANASSDVTANITVPTITDIYSSTSTDGMSGVAVASAVSGKQDILTAGDGIDITSNVISVDGETTTEIDTETPTELTLATVATTGSYNDLTDTSGVQTTSNLVTSVSSSSTDSQYPSAKLFYDTCNNVAKNGTYQGVDLTVKFADEIATAGSVTAWLHARCQAGNFTGINPFDYFWDTTVAQTVDGTAITAGEDRKCVIAAIDPYYNTGQTAMGHHLTVFAGFSKAKVVFNTTKNNNGSDYDANPWRASKLFAVLNGVNNSTTNNIGDVGFDATGGCYLNTFSSALRGIMVEQVVDLPQRYTADSTLTDHTAVAWASRGKLFAPSEIEVFGTLIHSKRATMAGQEYEGYGPYCQWDIFKTAASRLLFGRSYYWLSSVAGGGSNRACLVNGNGTAASYQTNDTTPYAPLCFHIA